VAGERRARRALDAAPDDRLRGRSHKRRAASAVEADVAPERRAVPSPIAEEDETRYTQCGVSRISPAVPYSIADDSPIPGDDLSDPDLPLPARAQPREGRRPSALQAAAERLRLGGGGMERQSPRTARRGTRYANK
jgi:hypothetical protein